MDKRYLTVLLLTLLVCFLFAFCFYLFWYNGDRITNCRSYKDSSIRAYVKKTLPLVGGYVLTIFEKQITASGERLRKYKYDIDFFSGMGRLISLGFFPDEDNFMLRHKLPSDKPLHYRVKFYDKSGLVLELPEVLWGDWSLYDAQHVIFNEKAHWGHYFFCGAHVSFRMSKILVLNIPEEDIPAGWRAAVKNNFCRPATPTAEASKVGGYEVYNYLILNGLPINLLDNYVRGGGYYEMLHDRLTLEGFRLDVQFPGEYDSDRRKMEAHVFELIPGATLIPKTIHCCN